jgi:hypothetical protein
MTAIVPQNGWRDHWPRRRSGAAFLGSPWRTTGAANRNGFCYSLVAAGASGDDRRPGDAWNPRDSAACLVVAIRTALFPFPPHPFSGVPRDA